MLESHMLPLCTIDLVLLLQKCVAQSSKMELSKAHQKMRGADSGLDSDKTKT